MSGAPAVNGDLANGGFRERDSRLCATTLRCMNLSLMSSTTRDTLRGKAAVIGAGLSAVGRVPGRSPLMLAADAATKALADAGVGRADIDGVLASSAFASSFHRFSVAFSEYFGIRPTFSNTLQVSGATAATMFNIGAAAIAGGVPAVRATGRWRRTGLHALGHRETGPRLGRTWTALLAIQALSS